MVQIRSFTDVDQVLKEYVPDARSMRANYKLDTMRTLMRLLGDPQETYRVIHVAGTSGKTSTAYYAAAILSQTGKRVGLTVSPHVDQVNERVQINLVPLAEADYCREFQTFIRLIQDLSVQPTYFELLVAFAYWEFARQNVDYAVVEVGLGGLLDGTNVVQRSDKISILADIGLDHVDILGHDLATIAAQKAGIILPDSDVFCLTQGSDVLQVFQEFADTQGARLHSLNYALDQQAQIQTAALPLFQRRNWLLAHTVVDFVIQQDNLPVLTDQQLQQAIATHIPARMEILDLGGKQLVLDAAHNPQKMQALVPSLQARFPGQKFAVLLALLRSKDARLEGVLTELLPITSHLIVTDFVAGQDLRKHSTEPSQIVAACHKLGFENVEIIQDTKAAYQALQQRPEQLLLATGSFYLLHDIHKLKRESLQ